jgi:PAS domain S-box-containing protein
MMAEMQAATILVVDDNPSGRYSTSRMLRAAGFAVLEAATGGEGLALALGADLVVLDVNLPDIDGFEVCRRIRSNSQTARVPVIHLSATFVKDVDKVQGLEAGADGYLTHPVEPPVLVATVNAFLRARRAEDAMRKSEAKFRAIFDQAPTGILLLSKDLVYLESNPAMCRLLGRTREEIVGRDASAFMPEDLKAQAAVIAGELEEFGVWSGTFPLLRADGKQIALEWNIAVHSAPGVRLAIVTDVTQRRVIEEDRERALLAERAARSEAERANRLKDEFLATLSHELRTPLNAIVGWSQILKTGQPSMEELAEGIEAIERNATAQAQLISDLLDVSSITSGKVRLDVQTVDLAVMIHNAIEAVIPALRAKEIEIRRMLDPNAGTILGDPARLQQVIWNLVNNAAKFTPKGGRIEVNLQRENSSANITVSDNGKGIKADFLPYIFERFRQEDATAKRNQGGLGLGLAIVKHLTEMHGGKVSASSAGEGMGASFVVSLPLSPVQPMAMSGGEERATEPPAAGTMMNCSTAALQGLRILIVEDDPDARTLIKRILAARQGEVLDAKDAASALAAVEDFKPNVLISDVGMPGKDGYDLIREIRGKGYSMKELPAIALTAFARTEDRQHAMLSGFQVHLAKPVNPNELVAAVVAVAGRAQKAE